MAAVATLACISQAALSHAQETEVTKPIEAQKPVPDVPPAPPAAPAGSEAAPRPTAPAVFPILALDVTGVHALQPAEIEALVYPFLGPDRGPKDVEAAKAAIEKAYHDKGFQAVSVVVPQQPTDRFVAGVIQLDVYEAPLATVTVADAKYHDVAKLAEKLPALEKGKALNLTELQRQIDAQNRFPDRQITPAFEPGVEPGTVDVKLDVTDKFPVHGSAELNNDNSPSTTRLRYSGTARYTNLFGLGHTVSGTVLVAPENPKDTRVYSGSYTAPLIGSPWTLLVYGYKSNSDIAALGGTNVLGNGYQIGVRAVLRLPATKTFQTLSFGPDFKDFQQDIVVGTTVGKAPLRYVPFTLEYGLSGASASGRSTYDLTVGSTLGLRIIKRTVCVDVGAAKCVIVDQFRNREVFSNENFARLNIGLNATQELPYGFSVASHISAQVADSHLATNEQFAIGGLSSLRGYYQSEGVGDDGITSGLELRWPPFADYIGKPISDLRFYSFIDTGIVHTQDALPGTISTQHLFAVGAGARAQIFDILSGEFVVAVPLRDGSTSKSGDVRSVFVVKAEF